MFKKIAITLMIISWVQCSASDRKISIPKNCNSFDSCLEKSKESDVLRNKIRYLDGCIHYWNKADGDEKKIAAIIERAEYIIREAGGDTGYKGDDVVLKVNHKKEYRETSYNSAIKDLEMLLDNSKLDSKSKGKSEQLLNQAKKQKDSL